MVFEPNSLSFHGFTSILDLYEFWNEKEVCLCVLPAFCLEIWTGIFEHSWIRFCLWPLWLVSRNKPVILRSSSSLVRNREILSLFFSFVIVLEFVANGDELALELRRKTIRWWIFVKNLWGLMNFPADLCLILILENSRVCSWFLMIFCFWFVTE